MSDIERFELLAWLIGHRNRPTVSAGRALCGNDATAFALYAVERCKKFCGSVCHDLHFLVCVRFASVCQQ
ncbi:MAG: hypothetical protein WBS33_10370 [Verrucomicrobiia bacterium]